MGVDGNRMRRALDHELRRANYVTSWVTGDYHKKFRREAASQRDFFMGEKLT